MIAVTVIDRREFLKIAGVAGAGLVLGVRIGSAADEAGGFRPNAFLAVDTAGGVKIWIPRAELGQGAITSLTVLVAEELCADWPSIETVLAPAEQKYGEMVTGGSRSVRTSWEPLRRAGAAAREMLLEAAAKRWGVAKSGLRAERGRVTDPASGRALAYAELAESAASLEPPEDPPLRGRTDWTYIGVSPPRIDIPWKVDGSARFGADVEMPGMLRAVIARCPVFGGTVDTFDGSKTLALPGVRAVLPVGGGVAVVADSTWAAIRGREALAVKWSEGKNASLDDGAITRILEETSRGDAATARKEGDVDAAFAGAARTLEAEYSLAYISHSPMEPMNCIAHADRGRCRVVVPTQNAMDARATAAAAAGLEFPQVELQPTLSGGGFGRRLMADFVAEAVALAGQLDAPVQVVWTREDDMRHDWYRPASLHRLAAALDGNGNLVGWKHRVTAPSIEAQWRKLEGAPGGFTRGSADILYRIPNMRVDCAVAPIPIPIGYWRAVFNNNNAFAGESFLDEIAAATGKDPVALRLELLPDGSRLRGAVEAVAALAEWGKAAPEGRARGFACHECFGTAAAEVAEVSVERGAIRVHRVWCAIDPGVAVHPDGLTAQVEGGVVLGLSEALRGEINFRGGRAVQGNFDEYEPLRMDEVPEVTARILESGEPVGGIGEPPVPPAAPAVANAVFAATGKRVRRLPMQKEARRLG